MLRQFNLKQQQFAVLNEIIWYGPICQKELTEKLLYRKSNISKIIKILSDKKLIQVTADPNRQAPHAAYGNSCRGSTVEVTFKLLKKLEK